MFSGFGGGGGGRGGRSRGGRMGGGMPGMGGGFGGGMPGGFGESAGASSAPPPPGEIVRPLALSLEELYSGRACFGGSLQAWMEEGKRLLKSSS
jgi:DnaJ family protein B protein 4